MDQGRNSSHIVIAGGGLAAQRAIETLRRNDHTGPITVICAEPLRPYDRPPLSKGVLAGETEAAELTFRSDDWYRERNVELRLGPVSYTHLTLPTIYTV